MLFALFDCESRIDKSLLRRVRYPELPDTPEGDAQAYEFETATLRDRQGLKPDEQPWLNVQWHIPISIAVGVVDPSDYLLANVETLLADELPGSATNYEREIVSVFWSRAEAFRQRKGVFVGFNSRGFDFPLLELAALRHGIPTPLHLNDKYGSRYRFSETHLDLLEILTNYGANRPPAGGLSYYLQLIGATGKGTIDGAQVQALYEAGELERVSRYCRNDVRRLYALFLRVQVMRGQLDPAKARELASAIKLEAE